MFARGDDVNQAYDAILPYVNLTEPDQSALVANVAGGHNCWQASARACADILTVWIRNWAGSAAAGGTQIQLVAPIDKTVGDEQGLPAVAGPVSRAPSGRCCAATASACAAISPRRPTRARRSLPAPTWTRPMPPRRPR